MIYKTFSTWCFVIMLFPGKILFAQVDKTLLEADNYYRSGNYEMSLKLLKSIHLYKDEQLIQKEILFAENLIALRISEDSIRDQLILIYNINPNFNPQSLNFDISDALLQRLEAILVYPRVIFSIEGSLNSILPIISKQPYVCPECVQHDRYLNASLSEGLGIRITLMKNKHFGMEAGFGINTGTYQRKIQSASGQDDYNLLFTEKMQFLNVPVRVVCTKKIWTFKTGINYKYLLKSSISGLLTNKTPYNETSQSTYTRTNAENSRNRNLIFLSAEVSRTLVKLKNQNWFIVIGSELQYGLNSITRIDKRFSDISFISDTYYTDDFLHLCFINITIALYFKANHTVK